MFLTCALIAVAAVKEQGSVYSASQHSTLEPELLKDVDSTYDVSEMVEKFPRDILMVSSTSFPHESKPLGSSSSQSPLSTMPPLCPLHSASQMHLDSDAVSSMHLGSNVISLMLAAEGFYEFLSMYGTREIPQIQSPLPPTHGPILPSTSLMPKPLSISEVASSANNNITPQQASPLPVCQVNTPSQSDIQGRQSSSMITDLITKDAMVPVESHSQTPSIPVKSHPRAPSKSTSMEPSLMSTDTEPAPVSTSVEPSPMSTSIEPAPVSSSTLAEPTPSSKVTVSLIVSPTSAESAPVSSSTSAEPTPSSKVTVSLIVSHGK